MTPHNHLGADFSRAGSFASWHSPFARQPEKNPMILIAVAWLYVVLMVAVVEATGTQGTVLGAGFTFLLYGILPVAILMYLMLSPARRRGRRAAEAMRTSISADPVNPDRSGHAPSDPVAPVREEP
jgi:hypothetical protein